MKVEEVFMAIAAAFPHFPLLQTERLRLRPIEMDDVDAIFALYRDDTVVPHLDIDTLTERTQAEEITQFYIDRYRNQRSIRWAVTLHQQSQLIGTCGFHPFDHEHCRVEIAYELLSTYQRQGIMTEAVHAMIAYGFTTLALHRIEAVTPPDNVASQYLLAKVGFQREGVLRQRSFYRGRYVDDIHFGLLAAEYQPLAAIRRAIA